MVCYRPLHAFVGKTNAETGKAPSVWKRKDSPEQERRELPCGRCIGCRIERSRQWAVRCVHEAQMHDENCFITLTYDEKNLPENGSLDVTHFQKFMKRLRRRIGNVRFYHSGEYGETFGRPHYHAIIFGYDFLDKKLFSMASGYRIYTSESLMDIWGKGHATVGKVSFESAAYVARYVVKKTTGSLADEVYVNKVTGEMRKPEYSTMSRNPGIGFSWFEKYLGDVYPSDFIVIKGNKIRPPRRYDEWLEKMSPFMYDEIKLVRRENMPFWEEMSDRRLMVKEEVKTAQLKLLKRGLEV